MAARFCASAISVGAIICMAMLVAFGFLGSAIGLAFDQISLAIGLAAGFLFLVAFFIGGFATAFAMPLGRGVGPYFHALATWAVVIVVGSIAFGSQAARISEVGLQGLGIGAASTLGTDALLEKLRELRPTLVTEVKIKEGRAVSTLTMKPPSARSTTSAATQSAHEDEQILNSHADEIDTAKSKAEELGRHVGWVGFFSLITALVATIVGSAFGQRFALRPHST